MNTYLKYQPAAIHFLSFLAIAGLFFWIDYEASSYLFPDISAVLLDKKAVFTPDMVTRFKWVQVVASVISFVAPALLFSYFSSPKILPYLGVRKSISPVIAAAAVILLVCVQPFVSWLGELNQHIDFGKMQKTLQAAEALYNRALEVFLQMNNVGDLLINLLVMALLPAVAEELFFRGSLQKVLLRLTNLPWLSIIISAAIFAWLHDTFFKIIPIFTLGLLLGTVYYVTRNIWYTIIIHFLNNALAVSSVYFAKSSDTIKKLSSDNLTVPVYLALISLLLTIGLIYFIKMTSDEVLPVFIADDENDYIP